MLDSGAASLIPLTFELDARYLEVVDAHRQGSDSRMYCQHLGAGSCALMLYLDKTNGTYHVANLGDSRMVLAKNCGLVYGS